MVCSVLAGKLAGHLILGAAQNERAQGIAQELAGFFVDRLRPAPLASLKTLAAPSMPGFRNSNSDHNSPMWFSTGVR
jgi:hypothetical protein